VGSPFVYAKSSTPEGWTSSSEWGRRTVSVRHAFVNGDQDQGRQHCLSDLKMEMARHTGPFLLSMLTPEKLEVRFNTKGSGGRVTLSKLSLFAEDGSEGFCFFLEDASDVCSNIGFLGRAGDAQGYTGNFSRGTA
jgi:hypothetical protein